MIRWYTLPCVEQFCFQHLHATKGMGIGAAARVWQEQTNHKLVRHRASDLSKSLKRAGLDGMAEYSIGCCPVDMEDKVKEMLDPIYEAEVELWLCSRVSQTLDFTSVSHS